MKQDDISMSLLTLDSINDYKLMKHFSIPCVFTNLSGNDALSSHQDHAKRRQATVNYFLSNANKLLS